MRSRLATQSIDRTWFVDLLNSAEDLALGMNTRC